jgi:hypothetical protein
VWNSDSAVSAIKNGCNRTANKIQSSEPEPVINITCNPRTRDILMSDVGGSDHIGFIISGYDLKYMTIWY